MIAYTGRGIATTRRCCLLLIAAVLLIDPTCVDALRCGDATTLQSNTEYDLINCSVETVLTGTGPLSNVAVRARAGTRLPRIDIAAGNANTVNNLSIALSGMAVIEYGGPSTSSPIAVAAGTVANVLIAWHDVHLTRGGTGGMQMQHLASVEAATELRDVSIQLTSCVVDADVEQYALSVAPSRAAATLLTDLRVVVHDTTLNVVAALGYVGHLLRVGSSIKYSDLIIANIVVDVQRFHGSLLMCTYGGCDAAENTEIAWIGLTAYAAIRDVVVSLQDATWLARQPEATLATSKTNLRLININGIGAYEYIDTSSLTNFTASLTRINATLLATALCATIALHYFLDVSDVTVSVADANITGVAVGLLRNNDNFRNVEVVRLFSIVNIVRRVRVALRNVRVQHRLTCGAYGDGPFGAMDLQGMGSIVVHLGIRVTDVWVSLRTVLFHTDCTNGTYSSLTGSNGLAFGGQQTIMVLSKQGESMHDTSIDVQDSHLTLTVAMRPNLPSDILVGSVMGSSAMVVSLGASGSNITVAAVRCTVQIASMDFQQWPMKSDGPQCQLIPFQFNGRNVTAIVGSADTALLQVMCGNPAVSRDDIEHDNVHINITDCLIVNPWVFLHPPDAFAVYVPATRLRSSTVVIARSGGASSVPSTLLPASAPPLVSAPVVPGVSLLPVNLVSPAGATIQGTTFHVSQCRQITSVIAAQTADTLFGSDSSIVVERTELLSSPVPLRPTTRTPPFMVRSLQGSTMTFQQTTFAAHRVHLAEMSQFSDAATTQWQASSTVVFECGTLDGAYLRPAAAAAFVNAGDALRELGCHRTRTATDTLPPAVEPPPAVATKAAASASSASAVVLSGVLVATFSVPAGFGSVPALQMSSGALRLRASCASSDFRSTTDGDTGGDGDDQIGTEIADNPLQLTLGDDLSYAGGAVVGNVVLVVGGALLLVAAKHAVRIVGSLRRGEAWQWLPSPVDARCAAVSAAIPLYGVVLQPTAAAGALLVGSPGSSAGAVAVGCVGLLASVVPLCWMVWYVVRAFPLIAVARRRTPRDGALVRLATPGWKWAQKRSKADDAASRVQVLLHVLLCLIEPYRGGFHWMFAVELGSAFLQGLVVGAALTFGQAGDKGCAAADAAMWILFALCTVTVGLVVAGHPFSVRLDTVQAVVLNVLCSAVVLLSIFAIDDVASILVIVQSVWSLLLLLLPVGVAVLEVLGQLEWRHDEGKPSSSSASCAAGTTAKGNGGPRGMDDGPVKHPSADLGPKPPPPPRPRSGSTSLQSPQEAPKPRKPEPHELYFSDPRILLIDGPPARSGTGAAVVDGPPSVDDDDCYQLLEWARSSRTRRPPARRSLGATAAPLPFALAGSAATQRAERLRRIQRLSMFPPPSHPHEVLTRLEDILNEACTSAARNYRLLEP